MKSPYRPSAGRVKMADVSSKPSTLREARAQARVLMGAKTLRLIKEGRIPKGDVFSVAKIAGVMAAKKTPLLIPLCHPLELTSVLVDIELDEERPAVVIESTVRTRGRTGVEMEALTAVMASALTVYDMCKAFDKGMVVSEVVLLEKKGGRSGHYKREARPPAVARPLRNRLRAPA